MSQTSTYCNKLNKRTYKSRPLNCTIPFPWLHVINHVTKVKITTTKNNHFIANLPTIFFFFFYICSISVPLIFVCISTTRCLKLRCSTLVPLFLVLAFNNSIFVSSNFSSIERIFQSKTGMSAVDLLQIRGSNHWKKMHLLPPLTNRIQLKRKKKKMTKRRAFIFLIDWAKY